MFLMFFFIFAIFRIRKSVFYRSVMHLLPPTEWEYLSCQNIFLLSSSHSCGSLTFTFIKRKCSNFNSDVSSHDVSLIEKS